MKNISKISTAVKKAIKNVLSEEDIDYLTAKENKNLLSRLCSGIETEAKKVKTEIPKRMSAFGESYSLPPMLCYKNTNISPFSEFRIQGDDREFLLEEYPATPHEKIFPHIFRGELENFTFIKSLGISLKELEDHCITPAQADYSIEKWKKEFPNEDMNYVYFIKGHTDRKHFRELNKIEKTEGIGIVVLLSRMYKVENPLNKDPYRRTTWTEVIMTIDHKNDHMSGWKSYNLQSPVFILKDKK